MYLLNIFWHFDHFSIFDFVINVIVGTFVKNFSIYYIDLIGQHCKLL